VASRALDEIARRAPLHSRDQIPPVVLRVQASLYRLLSVESRVMFGLVIVVFAVFAAIVLSSSRVLRVFIESLDLVAVIGLFLVNWLGNGGALVPIPGARFIGLLLVFQQAVILPAWEVLAAAGAAMALGLMSYYLAGVRTAQSYAEGDDEGAEALAHETGMLDEDAEEFSPGGGLDAEAVTAIAGVKTDAASSEDAQEVPATRTGRLRHRFTTSLRRAQARAQPVIEQRGTAGMFLLCFSPTPLSTAGAYVGGLMRFGFKRYVVASFAAKFLLTGIIVALALTFSDAARAVQIPEVTIPVVNITLFDDGLPAPPGAPSPSPSVGPTD